MRHTTRRRKSHADNLAFGAAPRTVSERNHVSFITTPSENGMRLIGKALSARRMPMSGDVASVPPPGGMGVLGMTCSIVILSDVPEAQPSHPCHPEPKAKDLGGGLRAPVEPCRGFCSSLFARIPLKPPIRERC